MLLAGCASSQPAALQQAEARMRGYETREWHSDLTLHCDPKDAEVWLDGIPQGTCLDFPGDPRGLKLSDGMHRVEVKKSGFWPYETYVDSSGTRAALTIKLSPNH